MTKKLLQSLAVVCLLAGMGQAQNGNQGTLIASSTDCTTAGSCVSVKFDQPAAVGGSTVSLSGSFTATVQFEASNDGKALSDSTKTWVAINGTPANGTVAVTSATTANTWQFNVAGYTDIRARASAWTSAPTVVIRSTLTSAKSGGGGAVFASGGTTNNVIPKSNGSSALADSPLLAPDANTVRQANTTTSQAFEVYSTTDSNSTPVNFRRFEIVDSAGTFTVQLNKGGSAGNGDLFFGNNAGGRIIFRANGANALTLNTTGTLDFTTAAGLINKYKNIQTAGLGVPAVFGATSQKAETTTADANVLTYTPPAAVGTYRVSVNISVSSATSGVIAWTLSWTDSNGNAQSNIAMPLFQLGTAAPNTTFTTSAAGNYTGTSTIDVNNAAAAIIVKWVGGGTTAAKMSATIEQLQ